jgi:hypothetical protein
MTSVGLGALAAVTASALFSVGLILQSLEARTVSGEPSLRLSVLLCLVRRPRWLLGAVVMLAGFGLHVTALALAPLTVVQPALAAGLLVLLIAGLREGEGTVGTREILGVAGIVIGVAGLAFAAPDRSSDESNTGSIAVALAVLGVTVVIPQLFAITRTRGGGGGLLATFAAGASYAMTGVTTKLVSDALVDDQWAAALFWLALTALTAAIALVDQTSALQRRSVVEVGPIVFVVPVVIPVLLAPALVGETWDEAPYGALPLVLSLVVVCAATAALAGSHAVASAQAPAARQEAEGSV